MQPPYGRDPGMQDRQIRLSRFWWISVVRWILSLLLGTAVVGHPRTTVRCSPNFIGAYWLLQRPPDAPVGE